MVNENMRQNWNAGAAGWVENEALFDTVYAPVTNAVLEAAAIGPEHRMLDVGCGSGTLLAAGAVAGASVVGIDISEVMAEAARRRVPSATVLVADAQVTDLLEAAPGARFDRVVSRFGVMFFDDPVAAFANIRSACAPGARVVFGCWRTEEENPVFSMGSDVIRARLEPAQDPPGPNAPGPTAFADPDYLESLLTDAGWDSIRIDPFDFECDYGIGGSDGIEERLASIMGTGTGRAAREQLHPKLGAAGWKALMDDVRTELRRHLMDGVVKFPAATRLVSATNTAPYPAA